MPAWIHDRAKHIRKKNPDMDEGMSYAIATQQAHRLGKSPKTFKSKVTGRKERFGTPEGRAAAKAKFDKHKSEYKKTASEGNMDTALETNEPSVAGAMPDNGAASADPTIIGGGTPTNVSTELNPLFRNQTESHRGRETAVSNMSNPKTPTIKTAMYSGFIDEFMKIAGSPQKRIVGKELKRRARHLLSSTSHKLPRGEAEESLGAVVGAARKKLPWHTRAVQALKREEHPSVVRAVERHAGRG